MEGLELDGGIGHINKYASDESPRALLYLLFGPCTVGGTASVLERAGPASTFDDFDTCFHYGHFELQFCRVICLIGFGSDT